MWRKVLNIISWVLLASYLGAGLWLTHQHLDARAIQGMRIFLTDSLESHFVSRAEVSSILVAHGISTTGSLLNELNRDLVKNTVKTLPGVKDALVYTTPDGILTIEVAQRTPVMRYISTAGSYYIDSDRREMPLSENYSARVLIVTGAEDKNFLKDSLFRVVSAIRNEAFLNALIGEIAVKTDHTLEIIPRVGDQRIFFGDAGNPEWKLTKLRAFYQNGLPNVGWDRYSRIDLRYSNQIVARKWTKEERMARDSVRAVRDTANIQKPQKKV